jgi:hypothetical protein
MWTTVSPSSLARWRVSRNPLCAAGFDDAHDFADRTVRLEHVLQDILRDEKVERVVGESQPFQVFTSCTLVLHTKRLTFEEVRTGIVRAISPNEVVRRGRLVEGCLFPRRKVPIERDIHRANAWDGAAPRADVLITKPGAGFDESGVGAAARTPPRVRLLR